VRSVRDLDNISRFGNWRCWDTPLPPASEIPRFHGDRGKTRKNPGNKGVTDKVFNSKNLGDGTGAGRRRRCIAGQEASISWIEHAAGDVEQNRAVEKTKVTRRQSPVAGRQWPVVVSWRASGQDKTGSNRGFGGSSCGEFCFVRSVRSALCAQPSAERNEICVQLTRC